MNSASTANSATDSTPSLRPEVTRIIAGGQPVTVANASSKPVLMCGLLTAALLWLSFTPLEIASLAWLALVPICLLLRLQELPTYSYRLLAISGFVWAITTLQWMRLGHVAMYGALVALSLYLSLYFPAFIAITRRTVKAGFPIWLAVPVVWTALEFLRAYLMTGFSWYYLGHSQYKWTSLVQISDITGAYGVSFLVAMSSAVIATLLPAIVLVRLGLSKTPDGVVLTSIRQRRLSVSTFLLLLAVSCAYGMSRVPTGGESTNGPVVAIVQGNFTPEVKHDPDQWLRMVREHDMLSRRAAGLRPDLIVWPETMFPVPDQIVGKGVTDEDLGNMLTPDAMVDSARVAAEIERWHSGYARSLLENRSQEAGAAMLIGMLTDAAEKDGRRRFNSAAFIRPDVGYVGRYDKMHRVIFGEYIPLRSVLPWLAKATPFSAGFGIDAGQQSQAFDYADTRFAPIICFEDTVPHLVRDTVLNTDTAGNMPDVLINMTNDGWFRGSSELDQHLITATFRCIETRRPMIRAVNAGISAFIDSSGRIRQPEHFLIMNEQTAGVAAEWQAVASMIDPATGQRYRQCSAVMCGQVPLDGRSTVYLQFGDWFSILCAGFTCFGLIASTMKRSGTVTRTHDAPTAAANAA